MSDNVTLSYKREGEAFTGELDGVAFAGWSYARMMTEAHNELCKRPQAGLFITRTERAGLLPVQLEPQLLDLLRTDPARFIQANSLAPRTYDMRGDRTSKLAAGERYDIPKSVGLRACVDTLADAFGEHVYLRVRRGLSVEHPATGRWVSVSALHEWLGTDATELLASEAGGWLKVPTPYLLQTPAQRFFLPREWNTYGNWIARAALHDMYEQFIKEKSRCQSEATTATTP